MIVSSLVILLAALGLLTMGFYADSNSYLYSSIAASLLAGVALFIGARSRARRNEEAQAKSRAQAVSAAKRASRARAKGREADSSSDDSDEHLNKKDGPQQPFRARDAVTEELTKIDDSAPPAHTARAGENQSSGAPYPDWPDGQKPGLPPRTHEGGDSQRGGVPYQAGPGQVPAQRMSIASPPHSQDPYVSRHQSPTGHTPSHGTQVPPDMPPPGDWPPTDGRPDPTFAPQSQWDHWEEPLAEEASRAPGAYMQRSGEQQSGFPVDEAAVDSRFAQLTGNISNVREELPSAYAQNRAGSTGEYEQLQSDIAHWSEAANEAANSESGPGDEPEARELSSIEAAQLMRLDVLVQVIDGRPRFHLDDCSHLIGRDKEPLDLNEAIELGFSPCAQCDPVAHFNAEPAMH